MEGANNEDEALKMIPGDVRPSATSLRRHAPPMWWPGSGSSRPKSIRKAIEWGESQ